ISPSWRPRRGPRPLDGLRIWAPTTLSTTRSRSRRRSARSVSALRLSFSRRFPLAAFLQTCHELASFQLVELHLIAEQGHRVVLHARNGTRANDAKRGLPEAEAVVVGDLETIAGASDVARQVNALGRFDAVIHNAAVGYREGHRITSDGLPHVFVINTLAPYILTALIEKPKRLIYLSSGMHERADANIDDILWRKRPWNGSDAYAESELHDVMLA